ncbi:GNAT family N-acetyltransferase [Lachnoclostridium phytofermentans]|uniref:N-acetyltransferase domain-containing protein n=1 Tax=Lachnoclostridium phytofermentans (strain ATCC 700394 / DSM 18823 / ISDg) TaxID=357809 RepID=A9KNT1_LACP7|nr:GNAT family N-acetyltransferase [Lachnoclostridium phytofermentans]ABX41682.1 conserved hypothetical protein [Lachnoclostridium phytofermentans ISDg]
MYQLEEKDINLIRPFYEKSTDSTIYACLDGYMGKAFVDDKESTQHTIILQGDFVFPSNLGAFHEETAGRMIEDLLTYKDKYNMLIVPQTTEWKKFFKDSDKFSTITRYHLQSPSFEQFDPLKLEEYCNGLSKEFTFRRIDETLYEKVMSEDWSRDFCSNFSSVDDFLQHGIGILVMKGEEICCGASSYTAYRKGIEIEIVTEKDYRNLGLATACGAKLIQTCINEGKLPHWDAANETSVRLAMRLGYDYVGPYDTYCFK